MQKNKYLTLLPDILIYKGFSRCAIFDLKQSNHWFLPNEWGEILMNPNGFLAENLSVKLPTSSKEDIQNNLIFLKRNGIIDFAQHSSLKDVPTEAHILNYFTETCSIGIEKSFNSQFIPILSALRIKKLELHFLRNSNILNCILVANQLNFESLEIFLDYKYTKRLNLKELSCKVPKLTHIRIINTPFTYTEIYKQLEIKKLKNYSNHELNVKLLKRQENVNLHYYYNKRVHIDSDGTIKNSPYTANSYGNILTNSIDEVVHSEAFQKIWQVKKTLVDVCCDCELRAICIDRRPLIKRKGGTWFSNEACSYNPYLGKFKGESGYQPLNECGIESNKQGFKILVDQFIAIKTNYSNVALELDTNHNLFY
ncbi:MAG: hypothetical protein GQ574_04875 [Crocinitomix sp.]|nr:hypothetical protein [Crocinitomix sp.]